MPESIRELIEKAVMESLGREPADEGERAIEKARIYRANPGLLTAAVNEERREKRRGRR